MPKNRKTSIRHFAPRIFLLFWIWSSPSLSSAQEIDPLPTSYQGPKELSQLMTQIEKLQIEYPDSCITLIDSTLSVIKTNKWNEQEIEVLLYLKKGDALKTLGDQKLALQQYLQGRLIATSIQDKYYLAKTNYSIASYYSYFYQDEFARPYLEEATDFFENHTLYSESGMVFQELGQLYLTQNDQINALFYLEKARDIYSLQRDTLKTVSVMSDLGYCYNQFDLTEKGKIVSRQALGMIRNNSNPKSFYRELSSIAINYKYYNPDSAQILYEESITWASGKEDSLTTIISKYNYANVLMDLEKFPEARSELSAVEDYCRRNDIPMGIIMATLGYAYYDTKTGNIPRAIKKFENALKQMEQHGINYFQNVVYENLFECYTLLGNSAEAAQINLILDSLKAAENSDKLSRMYEFSQQAMLVENESNEKYLLEKNKKLLLKRTKLQKNILQFIVILLIIALIFWSRIIIIRRQRTASAQILLKQYKEERTSTIAKQEQRPFIEEAKLLRHFFETEKIFLDPNLKVEQLQEGLNLTYRDLQQLINTEYGLNFSELVNKYRVETAKTMLADPILANVTIDEISSQSGFGTRQRFYKAFQKTTGVSPGDFRKHMLQAQTSSTKKQS